MKKIIINDSKLYLFTVLLGAVAGAVIWLFLRLVGLFSEAIWEKLPEMTGFSRLPLMICVAGGLCAGLIRRKCGDYPEELPVVLGKIRKEKHYDYRPMAVMLACAFIPLVLGASVGPEAGMTGIIAGLCYWVGDNVKYAREHAREYSEIGAAVTLGSLFHMPLFGILAVEEPVAGEDYADASGDVDLPPLPRSTKVLLYGLSIAAAFLTMKGLSSLAGSPGEGFPSFEFEGITPADYAMTAIYIPAGLLLFWLFSYSEKLCSLISERIPSPLRETICGLGIGMIAMLVPEVLFSGEEQMGALQETCSVYAPLTLMGLCLLKLVVTAFCIRFGLKGGHFFPVIFACSCMGFGIAMAVFAAPAGHTVFAAAVITAAALGAQMKKPVATAMLLLICFPVRLILWILLGAAAGGRLAAAISGRQRQAGTETEIMK